MVGRIRTIALVVVSLIAVPVFAQAQFFTQGNLVVTVEGCGVNAGTCTNIPNGSGTGTGNSSNTGYGDNQAAPLTLFQYAPNGTSNPATFVNSLVFPQTTSGANVPVSGEYGSSMLILRYTAQRMKEHLPSQIVLQAKATRQSRAS
jgi:hypothetical protein